MHFDLMSVRHTTNWKLGTSSDELKVAATGCRVIFCHDLDQILNRLAVRSEPVVRFKCLTQR